jgi:hypothetical protein
MIDGFDNTAATVAAIKAKGGFPVCYYSAGSFEDWRPDAAKFNATTDLGSNLAGWPGERWINIRSDNVKTIMRVRMQMCKDKGFVAVDPDNVDGYTNGNGLGLTAADQLAYNTWTAQTAHSLGLGVGLKVRGGPRCVPGRATPRSTPLLSRQTHAHLPPPIPPPTSQPTHLLCPGALAPTPLQQNDLLQIPQLVSLYDFAVNEECMTYSECGLYSPMKAGAWLGGRTGGKQQHCPVRNTHRHRHALCSPKWTAPKPKHPPQSDCRSGTSSTPRRRSTSSAPSRRPSDCAASTRCAARRGAAPSSRRLLKETGSTRSTDLHTVPPCLMPTCA